MRKAICLSGQPRGMFECYDNLVKNVLEPNDWPDVFIHCWYDPNEEGEQYRHDLPFQKPGKRLHESFEKMYNPIVYKTEPQIEFPGLETYNSILQPDDERFIKSIQSMFYSIHECNYLKLQYELYNEFSYDMVMRLRFDLQIYEPIIFENYDKSVLNVYNDCRHECGCLTDHIALSSSENMDYYSQTYNNIERMYNSGCPFCAEIFLGRTLKECEVKIQHQEWKYGREGTGWDTL